jgi:hypothetical protein
MMLQPKEVKNLLFWLFEHLLICRKSITLKQSGASGIGTNTYVKCECGVEKDITDYDLW